MDWNEFHKEWDIFSKHPVKEVTCDEDEGYNQKYNKFLEYISTAIIHYPIKIAIDRLNKGIEWYNSQNAKTIKP